MQSLVLKTTLNGQMSCYLEAPQFFPMIVARLKSIESLGGELIIILDKGLYLLHILQFSLLEQSAWVLQLWHDCGSNGGTNTLHDHHSYFVCVHGCRRGWYRQGMIGILLGKEKYIILMFGLIGKFLDKTSSIVHPSRMVFICCCAACGLYGDIFAINITGNNNIIIIIIIIVINSESNSMHINYYVYLGWFGSRNQTHLCYQCMMHRNYRHYYCRFWGHRSIYHHNNHTHINTHHLWYNRRSFLWCMCHHHHHRGFVLFGGFVISYRNTGCLSCQGNIMS